MKRFEAPASEIVRRIAENIDDDTDFGDEDVLKDTLDLGQEDFWYQIDGDANPWVWGGSWFNPALNMVVHFEGIDQDGVKEVQPEDVEIPTTMLAKLPPEQPGWQDNIERDKLIDNYRIARAEFLNNRVAHKFWKMHVSAPNDYIFRQYDAKVKAQFDPEMAEQYDTWPLANKLIEIGRYAGFDSVAGQFEMTYNQAKAVLGRNNI